MAITTSQWSHVLTIPESYTPSAATSGQTLVITESVIAKLSAGDQTTFWSNVQNGGGDVRICTDSGGVNQLPVEVVSLDNSAQTCVIWTRKPSFDGTGNLYLFIGKAGETQPPVTDPFGRNAVWQDFRAVYHLSESPNSTTGGYIDSTGNGYDGTGIGITSERNSSPLGYGQEFGENKYIALPTSVFPTSAQSNFSISAWAQPDTLIGDQRIIGLENSVNNDDVAILWMDEGGAAKGWTAFTRVNSTNFIAGTDTASAQAGRWDFVVQNVSASVIEVHSNGSLLDSTPITLTVPPRTIDLANIGRTGSAPNEIFFSGGISQLEISLNYQPQEWIETKYANESSPATFFGTPTLATTGGGSATLAPTLIPSGEAVGTPSVTNLLKLVEATAIPTQEAIQSPVLNAGAILIAPAIIPTGEVVYNVSVVDLTQFIVAEDIPTQEVVGSPSLELLLSQIFPTAIATQEDFETPLIIGGDRIAIPINDRATWNRVAAYLRTRKFKGNDNDVILTWLRSEGYIDTFNDALNTYLEDVEALDGSLTDKYSNWRRQ